MPPATFTHKTILITGANSGIGYEAARQCLLLNAERVIFGVRSEKKGQEAISALRANPEIKKVNPGARLEVFRLDLDDYRSGLDFARKIKAEMKMLDVFIANAGMNVMRFMKSKSGHEKVMQVNAYTHFLIALELLPLLRSTATIRKSPSRLVMVGSSAQNMHNLSQLPKDKSIMAYLDDKSTYSGFRQYANSKLLMNAFVQHLASVIPAQEVITNTVDPGMVATGFDKELPGWLRGIMYMARKVFAKSVEDGGRTLVDAAGAVGEESHGRFLSHTHGVPSETPPLVGAEGKQFQERLWEDLLADLRNIDEKYRND